MTLAIYFELNSKKTERIQKIEQGPTRSYGLEDITKDNFEIERRTRVFKIVHRYIKTIHLTISLEGCVMS